MLKEWYSGLTWVASSVTVIATPIDMATHGHTFSQTACKFQVVQGHTVHIHLYMYER